MYKIKFNVDELYHHGILGQKWGVRRYQDKNGRLTAAGKKHDKILRKDYRKLSEEDVSKAKSDAIRRGDLKEVQENSIYFSDDEVRAAINRFNLNKDLSKYNPSDAEIALAKMKAAQEKMTTVADMVDKGARSWDIFAKIANGLHLTEEPLPTIYDKAEKAKKKLKYERDKNGKMQLVEEEGVDREGNSYFKNYREKETSQKQEDKAKQHQVMYYQDKKGRQIAKETYYDEKKNEYVTVEYATRKQKKKQDKQKKKQNNQQNP